MAWDPDIFPGGMAWIWQFTKHGVSEVHTFFTACNTGYAVLATAPVAEFDAHQRLFATITHSLHPGCSYGTARIRRGQGPGA